MIQISFTALHGDDYVLQIGAAEQGADPTVVDGTRDVFTTTEEDDTDVFMPVRCTSGAVRFYNKDNAWSTLADISDEHKPVTLLSNGSPVWSGYINKGYVGTRKLYGCNEECEICVQCPLSELDTVNYDPITDQTWTSGMKTLSWVLADILNDPFGDGVVSSPSIQQISDAATILALQVYVGPFYETYNGDDGTTTYRPKYTRKQALEEVLRMACCTARWTGTAVEIKEPKEMPSGGTTLNPAPIDMDSTETAVMPYKNVRVTANAEAVETAMDFPTLVLNNWAELNGIPQKVQQTAIIGPGVLNLKAVGLIWGRIGATFTPDDWRGITDDEFTYGTTDSGNNLLIAAYQQLTDDVAYSGYNLSPSIWLNYTHDYTITPQSNIQPTTVSVQTKTDFFIQDAILEIQMRLKENFCESNFSGVVMIRVSIGDKYYNYLASAWVTAANPLPFSVDTYFLKVTFENGQLKRTGNLDYNFDSYSGYGIPVTEALNGLLKIEIKASSDFDNDIITIDSFQVRAVRHVSDIRERGTYSATGSKGQGEDSIDLAFCSERRADNAYNFLFDGNGNVVKTVTIGGVALRPEQWVANRHAAMTTGKARSLLVLRQEDFTANKYLFNGKRYDTLCISHDWAENITEAHLIEIS